MGLFQSVVSLVTLGFSLCIVCVSLSGGRLSVTSSHRPGSVFPVGETLVQYTATDAAGNSRTCNLTVTVQGTNQSCLMCSLYIMTIGRIFKHFAPTLPNYCVLYSDKTMHYVCVCLGLTCDQPYVPVNGEFICSEEEEGVNCTLRCKDGYSFTQDAVHSYFCAYNGVWQPPYSPDRPDCSGKCCFLRYVVLLCVHSNNLLPQGRFSGAHVCFHWVWLTIKPMPTHMCRMIK